MTGRELIDGLAELRAAKVKRDETAIEGACRKLDEYVGSMEELFRFLDERRKTVKPSLTVEQIIEWVGRESRRPSRWTVATWGMMSQDYEFEALKGWLEERPGESSTPKKQPEDYGFSADRRSGTWYGIECSFTPTQAAIVSILLDAYEGGTPEVDAELLIGKDAFAQEIRKAQNKKPSAAKRVRDLFRRNPAWGKVIVPGDTRGTYRLKKP